MALISIHNRIIHRVCVTSHFDSDGKFHRFMRKHIENRVYRDSDLIRRPQSRILRALWTPSIFADFH